ncbi:MAG: tetratricopeptide repeat protein, partial [Candidatus Omnitrophota bacterium]
MLKNAVISLLVYVLLSFSLVSVAAAADAKDQSDILYDEAAQLIDVRKCDEAIVKLSALIKLDNLYAPAFVSRGYCYQIKGELDKAIEDQTRAIDLAPNIFGTAYGNRAVDFQLKGDLQLALADYTREIQIKPENSVAYLKRAIVYFNLKEYGKALEDTDKMVSLGGKPPADFVRVLLKRRDNPVPLGKSSSEETGISYYQAVLMVDSLLFQGDLDGAISKYTELIQQEPDLSLAYLQRGTCYVMKESNDAAIADLTRAIELAPGAYPEAYVNRGSSFHSKGDLSRAMADYDEAVALKFTSPQFIQNRAALFYDMKEYDKAWADVHKAEELG